MKCGADRPTTRPCFQDGRAIPGSDAQRPSSRQKPASTRHEPDARLRERCQLHHDHWRSAWQLLQRPAMRTGPSGCRCGGAIKGERRLRPQTRHRPLGSTDKPASTPSRCTSASFSPEDGFRGVERRSSVTRSQKKPYARPSGVWFADAAEDVNRAERPRGTLPYPARRKKDGAARGRCGRAFETRTMRQRMRSDRDDIKVAARVRTDMEFDRDHNPECISDAGPRSTCALRPRYCEQCGIPDMAAPRL